MDSETPQTKENSPTKEVGSEETSNEDKEIKDNASAAGTNEGGGHDNKSGDGNMAAEVEKETGDSATAAANVDDTKEPEAGENDEGSSSPQAERDTDASEETKKGKDASESNAQKAQSESETTEKEPLDTETGEEKEEETELQEKVRFDVSGGSSTEGTGEGEKVDPTAAANDTKQGEGTPTKQPLPSTDSERGKEPVWYSRTSLLITSVFSIFCFFPMGIVALYYGMKVKETYYSKHEAAQIKDYARRSTFCSIAAIVTGIAALLLILLVTILGITGVVRA